MKIFISWSGTQSKKLGEALRDWFPGVLQLLKPYFTPADIEKGTRWGAEIAKELESSEIGILCVTRDNLHSDWIMFEAGALSKSLDKAHVCPILFGITNTDLAGPLKQFQTTEFAKPDFHKLLTVINSRLGENKLPAKTLDAVFEKWWPELETQIANILKEVAATDIPIRSERELIEEVLELTRAAAKRAIRITPGISPNALIQLLEGVILLHDEQVDNIGSYQDTLDRLKALKASVTHISNRFKGSSDELDQLIERYSELDYKALSRSTDTSDDDIPF